MHGCCSRVEKCPPMRRYKRVALVLLAVVFVVIQFVPVHRTNRLGAGDPDAPRDVQWILRRACYDCHSTETRWPIWALGRVRLVTPCRHARLGWTRHVFASHAALVLRDTPSRRPHERGRRPGAPNVVSRGFRGTGSTEVARLKADPYSQGQPAARRRANVQSRERHSRPGRGFLR